MNRRHFTAGVTASLAAVGTPALAGDDSVTIDFTKEPPETTPRHEFPLPRYFMYDDSRAPVEINSDIIYTFANMVYLYTPPYVSYRLPRKLVVILDPITDFSLADWHHGLRPPAWLEKEKPIADFIVLQIASKIVPIFCQINIEQNRAAWHQEAFEILAKKFENMATMKREDALESFREHRTLNKHVLRFADFLEKALASDSLYDIATLSAGIVLDVAAIETYMATDAQRISQHRVWKTAFSIIEDACNLWRNA